MPRPLILLLAVLFSATVHGQEAKKPSPAVTRILDDAVRAVKRNRLDFDRLNQRPLGEARKALDDLSTKLIRDGKADEAAAVLRQVGTLEADVMRMANAPPPVVGGGAVPQKPLLERMAGKWHMDDWHMFIEQDGSCRQVRKDTGTAEATGRFVLNDAGVAEAKLTNGWSWLCSMPIGDDKLVVFFRNPEGQRTLGGVVHERVK